MSLLHYFPQKPKFKSSIWTESICFIPYQTPLGPTKPILSTQTGTTSARSQAEAFPNSCQTLLSLERPGSPVSFQNQKLTAKSQPRAKSSGPVLESKLQSQKSADLCFYIQFQLYSILAHKREPSSCLPKMGVCAPFFPPAPYSLGASKCLN